MDEQTRTDLIRRGWDIHRAVEESYLQHAPASRDTDPEAWRDRQRFLLADMAIHLLQTSLQPGAIDLEQLKHNVHAILTIADVFLPHAGLKQATDKIDNTSV